MTSIECSHVDYEWMHPLLHQYFARTGSRQAEHILKNWAEIRRGRRLRKVLPLAVARAMEDLKTAGTNAGQLSSAVRATVPGGVSFGAVSLCRRSAGQSGREIPDTPSRRFLLTWPTSRRRRSI